MIREVRFAATRFLRGRVAVVRQKLHGKRSADRTSWASRRSMQQTGTESAEVNPVDVRETRRVGPPRFVLVRSRS